MKQVFWGYFAGSVSYHDSFINPFNWHHWEAPATYKYPTVEAAGTIRNLRVQMVTAPGAGTSAAFTLYQNGIATAVDVTISDTATTGEDIINAVTVAVGDEIKVKGTKTGAAANSKIIGSIEFEGTEAGASIYGVAVGGAWDPTNVYYQGLFNSCNDWKDTASYVENIVLTPGNLTNYRLTSDGAPGSGKSFLFVIVKNGVVQDGTGGTTDTQVTIADGATSALWTGSLALVAGDVVYLRRTPSGSPGVMRIAIGVKFVATTDGLYNICGTTGSDQLSQTLTQYVNPTMCEGSSGLDQVEANQQMRGGITTVRISGVYVRLINPPGAGNARTISVRRNTASPFNGPSVTVSDLNTIGDTGTGVIDIAAGDVWTLQSVISAGGSASASSIAWTFIGGPVSGVIGGVIGPLPFVHWPRLVPDAVPGGSP